MKTSINEDKGYKIYELQKALILFLPLFVTNTICGEFHCNKYDMRRIFQKWKRVQVMYIQEAKLKRVKIWFHRILRRGE